MRPTFKKEGGAPFANQRRGEPPDKKFGRRGGAGGGSSNQNTIELTRVQQLEAKAARDAVIGAAPKASPAAAKKFVESISLDVDVEAARQLLLPSKALSALPNSIGMLCQQLRKLDVADNDLTDLSPLASLQHLSNLNVSRNARLASLKGLSGTCLSVLNVSFCAVESLVGLEHTALTLRTFIANDNRLQFQSPMFRSDGSARHEEDEETAAADMDAAREHLPSSLRASVPVNATAIRNLVIFATFQQCETVVLSRNDHLAHCFPAWSAEELSAACGDKPRQTAQDSGDESGDDESVEESSRTAAHRGNGGGQSKDEEAAEAAANKQLKHAIALAHPLSVFERLPRLKKLSLSGCELHSLPSRWFLPMVTELRLAQNHLTSLQPDGVILRSLHILDISNNLFCSVATLRRCRYLEQLNVRGNPLLDEGVLEDKASGYITEAAAQDSATAAGSHASTTAAAVPISVQQRVVRLFPSVKLLDNQPVLTTQEMRAAYKRGRDAATAASAAQQADEAAVAAKASDEASVHVAPAEGGVASEGHLENAPAPVRRPAAAAGARALARKAPRVDVAAIAAEAEEKDVVVEAPASVLKTSHAPIVRRERVLLRPGVAPAGKAGGGGGGGSAAGRAAEGKKKGSGGSTAPAPTMFGQAAVDKLLEQNRKTSAW